MASFVKSKIKAAREAIGKKDWAAAENNALQALEYEPDNYHGNVFLGLASVELGNNKQSEAAYRKAIVSSPEQVLAWQGLSKYYERVGDWKDYAETLVKMMDLHAKANDATKCAEALQKLIDVRRSRGTSEELYDTLLLLLPSSSYYNVLSSLPPPEPTAPTSTTTYAIQSAIQNSLPILEELVSMEEKREERFINSEVDKRRMRLNALP
ncbi:Superkiller protein 3, partial [Tulasnella sp. 403]